MLTDGAAMSRFMLLYRGAPSDMSAMSDEDVATEMKRWETWGQEMGERLVDFGSPFAASTSVVDDGTRADACGVTGYSIVEVADLDAAQACCDGHPFLADGGGDYAIDVFEMIDMSGT